MQDRIFLESGNMAKYIPLAEIIGVGVLHSDARHAVLRQEMKDFPPQPLGRRAPRPAAFGEESQPALVPGPTSSRRPHSRGRDTGTRPPLTAGGWEQFSRLGGAGGGGSPLRVAEDPGPRLPASSWAVPRPEPEEETTPG